MFGVWWIDWKLLIRHWQKDLNWIHRMFSGGNSESGSYRLRKALTSSLQHSRLHHKSKIMVIRAVVLATLLHAFEAWNSYRCDIKGLERFQQINFWRILPINWVERITNNEVLSRAPFQSIEATILQHGFRWVDHVSWSCPRWLSQLGELACCKRLSGSSKRRFKHKLKSYLSQDSIYGETRKALLQIDLLGVGLPEVWLRH